MLPTFTVLNFDVITFPFVIFFALVSCIIVYILSPNYKRYFQIIVFKICLSTLLFAAIGARFFSAITLLASSNESFWYNIIYGGSVFYGGVIGGIAGLLLVCRHKHYEFFVFTDLFATILPLGHAIGRLGCYLNGCCYGKTYNRIFAINYIVDGIQTMVFPTWFFEAFFCGVLFLYFQFIHRNNATGNRTAIYLLSYSIYRFLIEFMRGDKIRGFLGLFSSSQIISVFALICGFIILLISYKDSHENYLFTKEKKHADQSISKAI